MSDKQRTQCPRQVTWGGGFAVVGAALMVVSAYQGLANLRSVDTRDQLTGVLDSSAARDLGVTLEQATNVLHGALLVGGVTSGVAAVFAVFALLGNRSARGVLTGLTVLVLVSSIAVDPFLGLGIALAVSQLWSRPARDWYAGRPPATAEGRADRAEPVSDERSAPVLESGSEPPQPDQPPQSPQPPQSAQPAQQAGPAPTYGFGGYPAPSVPGQQPPGQQPPGQPYSAQPAPYGLPYGLPGAPLPPDPARAPGVIRAAAILTWAFSGLAMVAFVVTGFVLAIDQDQLLDRVTSKPEYQNLSLDRNDLVVAMWVTLLVFVVWSLTACVLAAFVWRRHEWARILLALSAGVTVLFCLIAMPVSVVHLVAAAVVLGLLFSPTSGRWFKTRLSTPAPGPFQAGPAPYPDQPGQDPRYPGGQQQPPPEQPPGDGKPPVW